MDVVVRNGLVFDGSGADGVLADVAVKDGRVAAIGKDLPGTTSIDARGCWVTPGFIDIHTHYDAEIELAPALSESVKHGVTTVTLGSCSLSLALGTPEDLADQFARVEAIPYAFVRDLLEQRKTWNTHADYFAHLRGLALGPNVVSFVGHSAVRAHVLGMERSLDRRVRPNDDEIRRMQDLIREGLDAGCIGLSVQTLPWDKIGGSRDIRSRPLPSTFARWSEYHRLLADVRARGLVFQGVPNVSTKWNILRFLLASTGLFRKPLKTTVISLMDAPGQRFLRHLQGWMSRIANRVLGADFRWQALPEKFDLWSDGIDLVVFEELGAGAAALHLQDDVERARLLSQPEYRKWFAQQWKNPFLPRIFHRNFASTLILDAPDKTLVGRSFAEVAKDRGQDVALTFLDLCVLHGKALRWYTVMTNDRPSVLAKIVAHPDVLIGFSDAGAHLRNMAHYNFPLRMLRLVNDSKVMSIGRGVHRVTGELADWFGIDAGRIAVGKAADLVVLDPTRLSAKLDEPVEAAMPFFGGFQRLVNPASGAVRHVLVHGQSAVQDGELTGVNAGRVLSRGAGGRGVREEEATRPASAECS